MKKKQTKGELHSLLVFIKRQRRLASIDRCNQSSKIKFYSVAEHCYFSTLFGMVLCDVINRQSHPEDRLNVEEVLRRLIIHDAEEAITGDILYPLHNDYPEFKKVLDKVREDVVQSQVFEELQTDLKHFYIRLWQSSKDDTLEGHFVKIIDKFELLMFAVQEMDMGNTTFRHIFIEALNVLRRECKFEPITKLVTIIELTCQ